MSDSVTGIIIAQRNYLENDQILTIFANTGEIVQVKAVSVRKLKSKNRSKTQIFSMGTFDIKQYENKFSVLKTVLLEESFLPLKTNLEKYYYALYFSEIIYRIGFYNALDNQLYNQFIYALKKLCDSEDLTVIRFVFEFKILEHTGLKPNFESCVICGNTNVVTACPKTGGFICSSCLRVTNKKYSLKTLAVLKALANSDLTTVGTIKLSNEVKEEVDDFLSDYFDFHINIKFNSKKYL